MAQGPVVTPTLPQRTEPRWSNRVRRAFLWIAVAMLLGVAFCEWCQSDAFAAVTAIPPWCWLIACVVIANLGMASARRWERITAAAIFLAFLAISVEQS